MLLWAVVSLVVNLLSTTTFAAVLFSLYRQLGSEGPIDSRLEFAGETDEVWLQITGRRLLVAGTICVVAAAALMAFSRTCQPWHDPFLQ